MPPQCVGEDAHDVAHLRPREAGKADHTRFILGIARKEAALLVNVQPYLKRQPQRFGCGRGGVQHTPRSTAGDTCDAIAG